MPRTQVVTSEHHGSVDVQGFRGLIVAGSEVGAVGLVLTAEVSTLPDVDPALTAGAQPLSPSLKGIGLAGWVSLSGSLDVEQTAEVDEVLLRGGTLAPGVVLPLGGEVSGGESNRQGVGSL